jgi:hypothetical protein
MANVQQEEPERDRRPRGHRKHAKFAWLLPLILLNLAVFGFGDAHPAVKTANLWFGAATFALAMHAAEAGRKQFLAAVTLALLAAAAWKSPYVRHWWFEFAAVAVFNVSTALAPVAILRKVRLEFSREGVDAEVVLGALCAYLYLGSWFSFIYRSVATLSKTPFFAQPGADTMLNYLYFSFTTITTTGFGDLSPAYGPGRMLAAIEAVVGQLYLVTVVAIVVSAYRKRR